MEHIPRIIAADRIVASRTLLAPQGYRPEYITNPWVHTIRSPSACHRVAQEAAGPHAAALHRGVEGRLLARPAAATEDPTLSVAAAVDVKAALTDLSLRLAAVKEGDEEDVATAHFYAEKISGDKLKDFAKTYLAAYPVAPIGPPIGGGYEDDWFGDAVR